MTAKLNLNPLINYFKDKDPKIASRLARVAAEQEKPFASGFLSDGDLMSKVVTLGKKNKSATQAELEDVKKMIGSYIMNSDRFKKDADKHLSRLKDKNTVFDLVKFFYDYILKAGGQGVIKAQTSNFQKLAQTLIEVADELDSTDPALAQEADDILATVVAQYCGMMEMDAGPMVSDDELPLDEVELAQDAPQYDEVGLDEFKDAIDGMKFRLTDAPKRENRMQAYEMAAKGQKYLSRGKELMERAHKMLDDGGEQIRFKTGFNW